MKCTHCGTEAEENQKFCTSCGKEMTEGDVANTVDNTEDTSIQEKEKLDEYIKKQKSLSDNYLKGFAGALVGGLIGAIPWIIASSLGWFVAWLGYFIAVAASKGYDLMEVKATMTKLWCVAISVVISVFAGQIISDVVIIVFSNDYGLTVADTFEMIFSDFGEYISLVSHNLLLGLVFAAIGGFGVLTQIRKESKLISEEENNTNEL